MNKWGDEMAKKIKLISNPIWIIIQVFLVISLFSSPPPAKADIAPFQFPGGAILLPGENSTQVRMIAETITFELGTPSPDVPVKAVVTADFTMRNLGDTPLRLKP